MVTVGHTPALGLPAAGHIQFVLIQSHTKTQPALTIT